MLYLLLSVAHAAPTAAACTTVLQNQAAWSVQAPPTPEEAAALCTTLSAPDPRPDAVLAADCYGSEKAYKAAKCEGLRKADAYLATASGCVEWFRAGAVTRGGPPQPWGLICNAMAQSPDREEALQTIHCMGDATFGASAACEKVRADLARFQLQAKREECRSNGSDLYTTALVADVNDKLVPAGKAPRAAPTPEAVAWVGNEGFTALGWAPGGPVRGVYWVEVNGHDPVVHCQLDLDGDGVPAEYITKAGTYGEAVTPEGVQ